jgi:hypothetical protein
MTGVSFHRLAERELNEAALYYEQESTGLGVTFLDEVEQLISEIVSSPLAGQNVREEIRR